jgi:hypothetical protein
VEWHTKFSLAYLKARLVRVKRKMQLKIVLADDASTEN